jgi:hypothetical protein
MGGYDQGGMAGVLNTVNQILSAGIAITAFSMLLYALSFNLRDRVARSFALILTCVVIVFTSKAIGSTVEETQTLSFWLRLTWVGIILLPAAYLHFSDALLSTTGRRSRGRRLWAVRLTYLFSFFLLFLLAAGVLVGPLVTDAYPAPYLRTTWLTELFTLYYMLVMLIAWVNFARAYRRTTTTTTRRRMIYLLAGATAPAFGSFPYLMFGYTFAAAIPIVFWSLATISNLLVGTLLVVMAYAVAFFGVPWPDRVVKSRLFKWLMRGSVTASVTLTLTTLVRRAGASFGSQYTALVPIVMVGTILLMEYLITLLSPLWDQILFYGKDRDDLMLFHSLEDRMLTHNDLRQFLELILASVCDRFQVKTAFIAAMNGQGMELVVKTGNYRSFDAQSMSEALLETDRQENGDSEGILRWGEYLLVPLHAEVGEDEVNSPLVGILGFLRPESRDIEEDQMEALDRLSRRAAQALQDRHVQYSVVQSLQALTPQVEEIQRLRADSSYNQSQILAAAEPARPEENMIGWVRDALNHYWGGPKLTESPLLNLKVVSDALKEHDENPSNALRSILRQAIERVKPEGERRFTGEWILYNILEMKFLEGRKVREIALRLAMSEADLYRKQRIAIEAVTKVIMDMEQQAHEEVAKTAN